MNKSNTLMVGLKLLFITILSFLVDAVVFLFFLFLTAGLVSTTSQPALVFFVFMIFFIICVVLWVATAGFFATRILKWV